MAAGQFFSFPASCVHRAVGGGARVAGEFVEIVFPCKTRWLDSRGPCPAAGMEKCKGQYLSFTSITAPLDI